MSKCTIRKKQETNNKKLYTEYYLTNLLRSMGYGVPLVKYTNSGELYELEYENIIGKAISKLNLNIVEHKDVINSINNISFALYTKRRTIEKELLLKFKMPLERFDADFIQKKNLYDLSSCFSIAEQVYNMMTDDNFGIVTDRSSENIIIREDNTIWHIDFESCRIGLKIENVAQYIFDPRNYFSLEDRIVLWTDNLPQKLKMYATPLAIYVMCLQAQYEKKHYKKIEERIQMCRYLKNHPVIDRVK